MCKEVYHCTPAELDAQDMDTVMMHMIFYNAELKDQADKAEVRDQKSRQRRPRRRGRR